MKSAQVVVTCSLFRKLIMGFLDDELSEKVRSAFLAHSVSCPICCKELKEMQFVRKALSGLSPVEVSSEFDFRLKASLTLEEVRLRSPMYRLQLYMKDNLVSVLGAPVAAALLLGGVLLYDGSLTGVHPGMQEGRNRIQTSSISRSSEEDVNYVLESVELSESGTKIKPREQAGVKSSGENSINLIKY